jgi:hypothetical protein
MQHDVRIDGGPNRDVGVQGQSEGEAKTFPEVKRHDGVSDRA